MLLLLLLLNFVSKNFSNYLFLGFHVSFSFFFTGKRNYNLFYCNVFVVVLCALMTVGVLVQSRVLAHMHALAAHNHVHVPSHICERTHDRVDSPAHVRAHTHVRVRVRGPYHDGHVHYHAHAGPHVHAGARSRAPSPDLVRAESPYVRDRVSVRVDVVAVVVGGGGVGVDDILVIYVDLWTMGDVVGMIAGVVVAAAVGSAFVVGAHCRYAWACALSTSALTPLSALLLLLAAVHLQLSHVRLVSVFVVVVVFVGVVVAVAAPVVYFSLASLSVLYAGAVVAVLDSWCISRSSHVLSAALFVVCVCVLLLLVL